ncbi:MAG TPA: ATP-binding protein [Chitinophagaceae bacterium]|jgi:sigma-B regulation protein RsbU (phosphoserine phosphatase)
MVVFNDEGEVLQLNATLLRLLRISPTEIPPAKFSDLLTVAGKIFYQTHFYPLLRLHGKAEEIFMTLRARTGETVPALAYAVRTENRTQCILVPVHERQKYEEEILFAKKTAEEALQNNQELIEAKNQLQKQAEELERRIRKSEQSNREMLQVSNILFHDLREPVRKIDTFSNLIRSQPILSDEVQFAVSRIEAASSRMRQLLNALQQFVSVEVGDESLARVDLNVTVQEAYSTVSRKYGEVPARLIVEPLPCIKGYPNQLSVLFLQLIDNAFKFRKPETELTIQITGTVVDENRFQAMPGPFRYVEFAQIFLADNGKGISQEYRASVFELLKKIDPRNPNAACGLAICKKIVENHFGSISVYPMAKHGTTFKILLPLKLEKTVPEQTS